MRVDRPGTGAKAQSYAIAHVVPEHLEEVRSRKLELIANSVEPRKNSKLTLLRTKRL
jgi:hypothetical protein